LTALEVEQEDKEKAQEVEETIESLPSADDVTLEDKENVEAARQAFNELTEEAQALVSNADDLIALEEELTALEVEQEDKEKAQEVEGMIESLPGVDDVTLEDKDLIAEATEAFNNLTDNQKQYVENADQLTALENKMKELESSEQTPVPQDPKDPEDPENPKDELSPGEGKKLDDGDSQALDGMNNQPGDNNQTDQSNRLPDTATNTFNYMLIGLLFVVVGTTLYLVRRRRFL
jgi:LPXTG-motif cell wall-anchored protein